MRRACTPAAVGVAALSLLILVAWPRISQRIPAPFVALVLATTVVASAAHLPVETIGTPLRTAQSRRCHTRSCRI